MPHHRQRFTNSLLEACSHLQLDKAGYATSGGPNARFLDITGLLQTAEGLLVADEDNYCLRMVSRSSSTHTQTYSGSCENEGIRDRRLLDACFLAPFSVNKPRGYISTTDRIACKMRRSYSINELISTKHIGDSHQLFDFVMGEEDVEEFVITTDHGILWVKDQQETFLVGSQQWNMQNIEFSGQFSGVAFYGPRSIAWLSNTTVLVANQYDSNVKIVDLEKWETSSVCQCK